MLITFKLTNRFLIYTVKYKNAKSKLFQQFNLKKKFPRILLLNTFGFCTIKDTLTN